MRCGTAEAALLHHITDHGVLGNIAVGLVCVSLGQTIMETRT
jgi:hypothetical protein